MNKIREYAKSTLEMAEKWKLVQKDDSDDE